MNIPSPEYLLPPGQYAYSVLEPLVAHAELQGATVREAAVGSVLSSLVALGRAALRYGAMDEYNAWRDHLQDTVEAVGERHIVFSADKGDRWPQSYLNELNFFGMLAGDNEAIQRLDNEFTSFPEDCGELIMGLCAREAFQPAFFVNPLAKTTGGSPWMKAPTIS